MTQTEQPATFLIPEQRKPTIDQHIEKLVVSEFVVQQITPEDRKLWLEMGRVRAKSYVDEKHFLSPEVLDVDGAEFDSHDQDATHYVVTAPDGSIIGTSRVIHKGDDEKNMLLPCETMFDVILSPNAREISRLIVDSRVDNRNSPLISLALIKAMTKETSDIDEPVYAVLEASLYRYLNDIIGITLDVVSEARHIGEYNSVNMLVSMHPRRITSQLHDRDQGRKRPLRGVPEKIAPFYEEHAQEKGLGLVAVSALGLPTSEQFNRNLGWMSKEELQHLHASMVAIAGVGGDGGELAVTLAQLGVGKFRLADPEAFEIDNLNRQTGASYKTIGRNKAEVIAEMIKDINPFAEVEVFVDGVNEDNIDDFTEGSQLVVDETEFTKHEIGVMIARSARKHHLPVLMALNVGFGSYVTSFDPEGKTFEDYLGLDVNASLEEIAEQEVHLSRWVPHIPSYADMSIFKKVAAGSVPTPTVAPGVKIAAGDASVQALSHLLKDITPVRKKLIRYAPRGRVIDVIDGFHEVRFPKIHFYQTAVRALWRTYREKNPRAGY